MPDLDRLTKREAYEAGIADGRTTQPAPDATVVMPTASENKAAEESMKSSWLRGEFWLIASFQLFITWAGVVVILAIIDAFQKTETPQTAELIAAIGAVSGVVGTIPYLYLNKRVEERKTAAVEASPTVVMSRRQQPGPQGERDAS